MRMGKADILDVDWIRHHIQVHCSLFARIIVFYGIFA